MKRTEGFTLVELLTVIAIVAVLAAILFPVFAQAREKARQTQCLSNLKQLGLAMNMYSQDWGGYLPAGVWDGGEGNPQGNWAGVYRVAGKCDPTKGQIYPYVKNAAVYLCPSDIGVDSSLLLFPDAKPYPLSYPMNDSLTLRSIDTIAAPPGRVGLLVQEDRRVINAGEFSFSRTLGILDDLPSKAHNDGTCVLYCDFHAKWGSCSTMIDAINNGDWDPDKP